MEIKKRFHIILKFFLNLKCEIKYKFNVRNK